MNTDRIYEFQILAQTLHYGSAASKLYISQSVLSRHIQSLEAELGVQLFMRSSHNVELTEAGITFYRLTKEFMNDMYTASEQTRVSSLELKGSIAIAILLPTLSQRLRTFFTQFTSHYTDIYLTPDVIVNAEMIRSDTYHFITTPSTSIALPEGFELVHKFEEPGCLVTSATPSTNFDSDVSLDQLKGQTLFIPGFSRSSGAFARVTQMVRQATDGNIHIISVPTPESAILNVELGRGYTIIPEHRLQQGSMQVRSINLKEKCGFETFLFRNRNMNSPEVDLFEEMFKKHMK